ncbi:carbohydrate ABC transporter permease, partial [Georgenia sp. 10Sc9-8]|nr:carbohydrate ABC transporter permease [Georgenia halotolerans]
MTTNPAPPQSFAKARPGEVDGGAPPGRQRKLSRAERRAIEAKGRLSSPWASGIAILIAVLWTVPTFGLLVTSFRPSGDIRASGWWTALGDPEFTLQNYADALSTGGGNLVAYFLNTIVITLPGVF